MPGICEVDNETPFAVAPLWVTDEECHDLLAVIVKGTYSIVSESRLVLAEDPLPVNFVGTLSGKPGESSYRYEPETAFFKGGTDVILLGHARSRRPVRELDVSLRVGPVHKVVRVIGDRHWTRTLGVISMSQPRPFERMPLMWEHAFGGWDRSNSDPTLHTFEARNPVGRGFRAKRASFEEGIALPNLEDPTNLLKSMTDAPMPVGFGFVSPDWQPRAGLAGTYDVAWLESRMPLLPYDFDRRFFNAAPADQVVPNYLKGDEDVLVSNASSSGALRFTLPGVPAPACQLAVDGPGHGSTSTQLDTVIIDADANSVTLLWRTFVGIPGGPHAVEAIRVYTPGATVLRPRSSGPHSASPAAVSARG